jgi:hypothetical protein
MLLDVRRPGVAWFIPQLAEALGVALRLSPGAVALVLAAELLAFG